MAETNYSNSAGRQEPPRDGGNEAPKTKKRKRRRRPLILTIIIRLFQLIGTLLLIGVITGSFLICYAAVYVKTVVMPQTYLNLDEYTMNENSIIYYEDKTSGQWVELQTLKGTENRELIKYTDIPQDLINAFVAIEDKRFWNHPGVDWKRTANGLLRMFTGGNIQGGSTIDQQLIKNVTEYDDVTVTRKILEIFKALELENNYQKEQILTVYFNRIYMGNGCFGVQAASQYYFGKDVWDLNLAECASLAGITNNPSLYAPYGQVDTFLYQCQVCKKTSSTKDYVCGYCGAEHSYDNGSVWTNREFNKARQELILREMAKEDEAREHPYISEAERDAAIAQPLVFTRDPKPSTGDGDPDEDGKQEETKQPSQYSWYVEAVIDDALDALMEARHINLAAAKQLVFCGGLSIYVPYDPEIQASVDAIYNDRSNLDKVSSRTGQRLMSSITVVDNSTGYVVAIGNTMEKTVDRGLNPAVHTTRQPGSSIKPLSVYSPAFEMRLITPATVLDDNPQLLNGNVWPTNSPAVYKGLTTILDGVTRSVNTIALRVVDMVTPKAAYDFMVERYGFTTLETYRVLSNGDVKSDIDRSPMAMGGLTDGVTTFEMAAAYATFPRNGMFTPATTILEIKDASDKTIIDNRGNTKPVIEARTAYYINAVLSNAVSSGTGTDAKISGQTVAGKTGTTNNRFNLWFCGYTAHYTAAVWTGYPYDEQINKSGEKNPSVLMWQKVMARIHEGRENVAFDVPGELTTYQICMDCGKVADSECAADSRGSRVQSMRMLKGDGPTDPCTCHVPVRVCLDSPILDAAGSPTGYYHLAGEFCPEERVKTIAYVDYERVLAKPTVSVGDHGALLSVYESYGNMPCDVHTEVPVTEDPGPDESGEPVTSDPPPVVTDPYVVPVTVPPEPPAPPETEPPVEPTVEPTEPPVEPTVEPTEPPYIPADDPEQDIE